MKRSVLSGAAMAAAVAFGAPASYADEVADFYAGKTISLYVATGGSGSYTAYNHQIADYFGRFMPGKPNTIVQFMAGAGGAKAANFVYNAAPKDGTAIVNLLKYVALEQAIGRPSVKYDVRKFNWLFSAEPVNSVIAIWHSAPATTLEGLRKAEVIMGSTGKSSETFITPTLMNAVFGTRFKIVTGYKTTGAIHIAMERGELHGRAASYSSLRDYPQWFAEKKIVVLAHSGLYRDAEFPEVPSLAEIAPDAASKEIFEFVGAGSTVGRVYAAPPGVPPARVAALRKAFEAMFKDERFLAEAKKRRLGIAPRPASEVEALVLKTVNAAPATIEKVKAIMMQ